MALASLTEGGEEHAGDGEMCVRHASLLSVACGILLLAHAACTYALQLRSARWDRVAASFIPIDALGALIRYLTGIAAIRWKSC